MRSRVGFQSLLCLSLFWQDLAMDGKRFADPERIGEMIPARVGRVGVNQNAESAMVEHQPWYQGSGNIRGEGDLKHRPIMRANLRVVPAAEPDHKTLAYPCAQLLRNPSRCGRVVIDVGMIAGNLRDGARLEYRFRLNHRCPLHSGAQNYHYARWLQHSRSRNDRRPGRTGPGHFRFCYGSVSKRWFPQNSR